MGRVTDWWREEVSCSELLWVWGCGGGGVRHGKGDAWARDGVALPGGGWIRLDLILLLER